MHRREFLKSTGLAAAAVTSVGAAANAGDLTLAAPAILSGTRELTFAFPFPDAANGMADAAHRLAHDITTATGGRYRFAIKGAASRGEADIYFGSPLDHVAASRAFAYFGGLPNSCGADPTLIAQWLAGGGDTYWDALGADLGFKPLLAGHTGNAPILWSSAPIRDLADIEGRTIFAPGLGRDVLTGLGAKPADLELAAVKDALASGDILAAECGGAVTSFGLGLPAAARYWTPSPFNEHGSTLALEIRKSVWVAMSAGDQAAFQGAAAMAFQLSIAEERTHQKQLMAAFAAQHGVQRVELTSQFMTAVLRVAVAVVAHAANYTETEHQVSMSYLKFATGDSSRYNTYRTYHVAAV